MSTLCGGSARAGKASSKAGARQRARSRWFAVAGRFRVITAPHPTTHRTGLASRVSSPAMNMATAAWLVSIPAPATSWSAPRAMPPLGSAGSFDGMPTGSATGRADGQRCRQVAGCGARALITSASATAGRRSLRYIGPQVVLDAPVSVAPRSADQQSVRPNRCPATRTRTALWQLVTRRPRAGLDIWRANSPVLCSKHT